jgi:hypothetical protein
VGLGEYTGTREEASGTQFFALPVKTHCSECIKP